MDELLRIEDLTVDLMTAQGILYVLDKVNLCVGQGEVHGLVGESGCGKSITSKAVMRLLDKKRSRISGSVVLAGISLLTVPERQMPRYRGRVLSMVFQEPMSSLSPLKTIGVQVEGALANHFPTLTHRERKARALTLLDHVGLTPVEKRYGQYPFELSGGMQQRVMIAQAVSCSPKLLIADEPTTALDVTIQAQILALLKELQAEYGMSILLITHNFGVVAQICRRVSVMYAGKIVETAPTRDLLSKPLHPYTQALIACIPQGKQRKHRLKALPGTPPRLFERTEGCSFFPRCPRASAACKTSPPLPNGREHVVSCHRAYGEADWKEGI
jgi:oligopeptide/dipeptide ABC transporter ATP-binding protein